MMDWKKTPLTNRLLLFFSMKYRILNKSARTRIFEGKNKTALI